MNTSDNLRFWGLVYAVIVGAAVFLQAYHIAAAAAYFGVALTLASKIKHLETLRHTRDGSAEKDR